MKYSVDFWCNLNSTEFRDLDTGGYNRKWQEVQKWLRAEVGAMHKDWYWYAGPAIFKFKREEDRVKFILRWM